MVDKTYKKRIDDGLTELLADKEIHGPHYSRDTAPEEIGELFQIVADLTEDLEPDGLRLFRSAGLSPQNPFHFGYLINMLASVHYTDGKIGRPRRGEKFAHLVQQLQAIADENNEYRTDELAKLYLRKCPDPIPSLKKWTGVKSAMRFLRIKIEKPER
ncbi:hypothetical protein ACFIOY_05460 [Bradyrhizobium sp. TZ2]